jgi:hypothetical protein
MNTYPHSDNLLASRTDMALATVYPSGAGMPLLHQCLSSPVMLREKSGSYLRPDMHLVCRIDMESLAEPPETVGHAAPDEVEWPSLP